MKLFSDGLELTDDQVASLHHNIVDIEGWIRDAIAGKAANCYSRLREEGIELLINDPQIHTMPATPTLLITAILNAPTYKDRAARDAKIASGG